MKQAAVIERERAIDTPSANQMIADHLAAKYNITPDLALKMLEPMTAERKEDARGALRDMEHALVLDPVLFKQIDAHKAGMALHLQMEELGARDEIERMILLQVKAMHGLTLRATQGAHQCKRMDQYRDYINVANKSSRTFATLIEGLSRHRGKTSEQKVTVEHVHVHSGGQAIVGSIDTGGSGGVATKTKELPHG